MFTISEEAEGQDAKDAQLSQDSEGFIAPAPMTRRTNGKLSTFFKRINFAYKPMEVTEGQKIRFVHEACGTLPMSAADTRVEISADLRDVFERWGSESAAAYAVVQELLGMTCFSVAEGILRAELLDVPGAVDAALKVVGIVGIVGFVGVSRW